MGWVMAADGAIDIAVVIPVVSALCGTIITLAGLIYRRLLEENRQLRGDLEKANAKLLAFQDLTPQLIDLVHGIEDRLDGYYREQRSSDSRQSGGRSSQSRPRIPGEGIR